jgi:hypothetical protein
MSIRYFTAVQVLLAACALGAPPPARAQEAADNAPFRVGSLAVAPVIRLTNMGRDSNVFNDSATDKRTSDVTATLSPFVEAWLRSSRVQLTSRSQWDYYYFRDLAGLRALDVDYSGRIDFTVNRLRPYVSGNVLTTRHRQSFEIDAIARRRNDDLEAGTYVRLTGKVFAGVYAGRSHVKYQSDSVFRGTNLAESLNHTGTREGVGLRYEATPLTTFALEAAQSQDRFEFSPQRNSDSVYIGPSVEFKPLALISGRAAIGVRRTRFRELDQPEFKSSVASIDLNYTLRARTQIAVGARRDLEYSFLYTHRDYVLTTVSTTVTQWLGDHWDVRANASRHRLAYRTYDAGQAAQASIGETVLSYGGNVGYHLGRHRIGIDVLHQQRSSNAGDGRDYDRLRIGSSLIYSF